MVPPVRRSVETWRKGTNVARPRTTLLSRDIIGRAAIEYVDSGKDLQLVPLARQLGVSVSSLYHHVDGRDGVIWAMRQALVAQYVREPDPEPDATTAAGIGTDTAANPAADTDWQRTIRREVEHTWRMYAEHPRVLELMVTVAIDEPDVLRFYSVLADALVAAGLPHSEIITTIEVIDAFSFGAAHDALSPDTILDAGQTEGRLGTLLTGHPSGSTRTRAVFDRGLDLLLAGIAARAKDVPQ